MAAQMQPLSQNPVHKKIPKSHSRFPHLTTKGVPQKGLFKKQQEKRGTCQKSGLNSRATTDIKPRVHMNTSKECPKQQLLKGITSCKIKVLRQIMLEISPGKLAKSLSHKFLVIPSSFCLDKFVTRHFSYRPPNARKFKDTKMTQL